MEERQTENGGRTVTFHRFNFFTTKIKLMLITKMPTRTALQAICCPCHGTIALLHQLCPYTHHQLLSSRQVQDYRGYDGASGGRTSRQRLRECPHGRRDCFLGDLDCSFPSFTWDICRVYITELRLARLVPWLHVPVTSLFVSHRLRICHHPLASGRIVDWSCCNTESSQLSNMVTLQLEPCFDGCVTTGRAGFLCTVC